MFFKFNLAKNSNILQELKREWIEKDHSGNYSASTIVGVNTRKEHGLFVVNDKKTDKYLVLLSHLQDELLDGENKYSLFSVEYESGTPEPNTGILSSFDLAPFPTFTYETEQFTIIKNVLMLKESTRLIVRYKLDGNFKPGSKLVIRPFMAYRDIDKLGKQISFYTENVFEMEKQFRFLPDPEMPEIYSIYSAGEFISAPIWYYNFFYRDEKTDKNENLLNPGFFEIPVKKGQEIFISFGLEEIPIDQVINLFAEEKRNRERLNSTLVQNNQLFPDLVERISHFEYHFTENSHYILDNLLSKEIKLTPFALSARRILRSGIEKELARKYFNSILELDNNGQLINVLMGQNPRLKADAFSPFAIIFFLYEYHNQYAEGDLLLRSLDIIHSIIHAIIKGKIPDIRVSFSKVLHMKKDAIPDFYKLAGVEIYPKDQSFLLNILWYNSLKIYSQLCSFSQIRNGKYEKVSNKVHQKLIGKFSLVMENIDDAFSDDADFEFHPAHIYCVSLPFQIFNQSQSENLVKILLHKFLSPDGIKYPTSDGKNVTSTILLSHYFESWYYFAKDELAFKNIFVNLKKNMSLQFRENLLGYTPLWFGVEDEYGFLASANSMSTSEVLYFLKRVHDLKIIES